MSQSSGTKQIVQFNKNEYLIEPICQVKIKSIYGNAFPQLQEFYFTPSSISYRSRKNVNSGGFVSSNTLKINYPGIQYNYSENISSLLKGLYIIEVKTISGFKYRISDENSPMQVKWNQADYSGTIEFFNSTLVPEKYLGREFPIIDDTVIPNPIGLAKTLTFNLPS